MSKKDEAMKLALDYLLSKQIGAHIIAAIREALAEQPCDMGQMCLNCQPRGPNGECPDKQPAQQALNKMAQNARDIGLDYEPSSGTQVSKVWRDGGKLVAKQVPLEDFYKPAQHRAWFTVDELNAWADKKLKENPQWADQPAQVDPCIDGSCSCCWAHLDEQSAQQEPFKSGEGASATVTITLPAQQVAWTLLLTGENQGLVGKAGEKFVGAPEYYERVDVYTSPRRTWVELTDEDKHYLNDVLNLQGRFPVIEAIEAKLREKNNG